MKAIVHINIRVTTEENPYDSCAPVYEVINTDLSQDDVARRVFDAVKGAVKALPRIAVSGNGAGG